MHKFLFLILLPMTLFAELLLITKDSIEYEESLQVDVEIISHVNSETVIAIGNPVKLDRSFKVAIVDANWDEKQHYFILFKRARRHNRNAVAKHGIILYDEKYFCILKTPLSVLNEYDAFTPYEIVKLEREEIERILPVRQKQTQREEKSPVVDSILQHVSVDSVWQMIGTLQELERYTYASNVQNSVTFLESYLENLNFDTVLTDNYLGNGSPNIIAEKRGTTTPEEIVIVCSHYDVTKSRYPGADDNGSGSAGTLEIARVISELHFEKTVRLLWFSGEEIGLLGSKDYAKKSANSGDNIVALFNLDMIGYLHPGDQLKLDVGYNAPSKSLYNKYIELTKLYLPDATIQDCKNSQWINSSDHKSFWDKGYNGLYFGDDLDPNGPENPYYHQLSDTLGTGVNSKPYLELATKSVMASLLTVAGVEKKTGIAASAGSLQALFHISDAGRKQFTIRANNEGSTSLQLITMSGKVIKRTTFKGEAALNLQGLSSGTYLLLLENSEGKMEKKLSF